MAEDEKRKFRTIRHVAVTTDPRNSTVVIVSVLDDGSVWCTQGTDDWVELQGVPGTQVRDGQDAESNPSMGGSGFGPSK